MIQMKRLLILIGCLRACSGTFRLQEVFSWNAMDWNYPDVLSHEQALRTGALIPENALPVGIERWNNKLFVSVPRWRAGIPATLNWVPLDGARDPSPKLNPYPDWDGNALGDCLNGLNTVYRIKVDKCDRLWVLDVGTYGYGDNTTNPCPYALNVFDLKTDTRLRRYVFRPSDIVATTFIANIAVDLGRSCDDAFAYFSDELGYGLIAYSWEQNRSWRFDHNFFLPDPLKGEFKIAGLTFNWGTEGIFGIAVTPPGDDGFRNLLFSPLASNTEFAVSTRVLRNESKVSIEQNYNDFQVIGVRNSDGHLTAKVIDDSGVQLFNLVDQNAIGCWNIARPYTPQNIAVVDRDDVGLVFPSDVKIDADKNVWVMSERMPVFLEAELDYSDINFRVFTAPLDVLLQGTVCEPPKKQFYIPQKNTRPVLNLRNKDSIKPYSVYDYRVIMSAPNAVPDDHEYTVNTNQPGINWRPAYAQNSGVYAKNNQYGAQIDNNRYPVRNNFQQRPNPQTPRFNSITNQQGQYAGQYSPLNQNQFSQQNWNQVLGNQGVTRNFNPPNFQNVNQPRNRNMQFQVNQPGNRNINRQLVQMQNPQVIENLNPQWNQNSFANNRALVHNNQPIIREWNDNNLKNPRVLVDNNLVIDHRANLAHRHVPYTAPRLPNRGLNTAIVNIPSQNNFPYQTTRGRELVSTTVTPAPFGAWSTHSYKVEEKET